MSAPEQAEVELANRNGRLHPSQRAAVLDLNFWAAAILVVAGICVLVIMPIEAGTGTYIAGAIPVLALIGWFGFVCWRRLSDVLGGRLVAITGWTHDFGQGRLTEQYPIGLRMSPAGFKSMETHSLRAGGRTYAVDRKFWPRLQPDRNNTVLVTPRSHILINVLPA